MIIRTQNMKGIGQIQIGIHWMSTISTHPGRESTHRGGYSRRNHMVCFEWITSWILSSIHFISFVVIVVEYNWQRWRLLAISVRSAIWPSFGITFISIRPTKYCSMEHFVRLRWRIRSTSPSRCPSTWVMRWNC